ncbi:MAG: hypothetical protein H7336_01070 [Bacteriovorax sp.]|nr:hypothetical protein [Bacteriovorax sp.]
MNITPNINQDNWTSSQYFSEPLRAFVSLGAAPVETPAGLQDVEFQYLVTMTDKDYQELFQSTHMSLDEALQVLNEKYGHWEMQDAGMKNSGDGCSSCAAH